MNATTNDEEDGDVGSLLGIFDEEPSNAKEHLYVYFSILQEDSTKKPSVFSSELSMEETLSETCEKLALHPLDFRTTPCSFDDTSSRPLLQVLVEVCAHAHSTRRDLYDALHNLTKEIGNEDYGNGSIPFLGWKLFCDPIVHECEIPLKDHPTESFKAQPTRNELRLSYEEHGFVMIRNAVKKMVILNPLKRTVLEHISKVMKQIHTVKRSDPTNKIKFREVMQRDEGRFDIDLSNVPELEDFIEYVSPKGGGASWIPLVSNILRGGGDTNNEESPSVSSSSQWGINRIGVVLSTGGNKTKEQFWHADGQSHLAANQALCCFLPLIDNLTETTGYTSFWSGSHNFQQHDLLALDVTSKMPKQTFVPGKISFGDALLYDYKVIHRGEANRMKDGEIRPILYIVYGNADFKEENFSCQSLHDFCADSRRHPEDEC